MIRTATDEDCAFLAKELWTNWHYLKVHQLKPMPREYSGPEELAEKIRNETSRWLIVGSPDEPVGFFSISSLKADKTFRRWGFSEDAIQIDDFSCLRGGEELLAQLRDLISYFKANSILLCIPAALRDAYWAALKSGFSLLGEVPLIVGTYAWLYLDRENKFQEIQTRLQRARVIPKR